MLDLTHVRAQFPAFSEPTLQGQAFFENAGGSYTCRPVIDRLTRFYTQRKVQPYAPYAASEAGGAEMDEARSRLARLMNVLNHLSKPVIGLVRTGFSPLNDLNLIPRPFRHDKL